MHTHDHVHEALYASISARRRPEDVADLVSRALGDALTGHESSILERAARGSLRRSFVGYTSMTERFAAPSTMGRSMRRAAMLFASAPAFDEAATSDPARIESFLRAIGEEIGKGFGANDFKVHRLNGVGREANGIELSRRRYNRQFRLLRRMEEKLRRLIREQRKATYVRVGKSGLASWLSRDEFLANDSSAAFIAYFVARSNLRSEFTVSGQQRPYDEIADVLFRRCLGDRGASFWAIAHVHPTTEVLVRLTDEEKGRLLGRWHELLVEIADLLEELFGASRLDPSSMVVRRGDDSTTWNNTVKAWNTARSHWIALLFAMGADAILDTICPGKAMALIAGDVAAWHRAVGHVDNVELRVFAGVPRPWDVLAGRATCTRADLEVACRRAGVDGGRSGWTAPRRPSVVPFRETPELVHGVSVGSPRLAKLLRDAGCFSGKGVRMS